ncbi:hypothetical protein, conserved [Babesia bigemina]|uniref:C3H1-type domain-containing protein n=1 Tax=Babesia bigemina TaxID=5866 RepID=A0A061BQN2_BABBI|nr:hypothetical protein, conserved [Babesia bigemina]CDR71783.1 hypothetical protein, conserved [Babesia bigemina]|eukprot:XP_012770727.1 hypothetical protein, conserved [Babesia bigemina]
MGFLSGVLDAVKDDDAVRTYDKDISGDKIDTVINTLNKKIGSGRHGLAASVAAVKGWLEGYELEYRKKASNVTEVLGELKTKIAGKYTHDVAGAAGEKLETQLTRWTETLESIELDVNNTENQYVNMLDSTLKRDAMREVKPINTSVNMLLDAAQNPEVTEQVKVVDWMLDEQEKRVKNEIRKHSKQLRETSDGEFRKVLGKIFELKNNKHEQFGHVRNVVGMAKEEAQGLLARFDGEYRKQIIRHFDAIKGALADVNMKENPTGKMNTSKLKEDAEKIKTSLETISLRLGGHVGELENWMYKTKNHINEFKEQEVEKIIELNKGGFGSWKENITQAAKEVYTETNRFDEQFQLLKAKLEEEVEHVNGRGGALSQLTALENHMNGEVPRELAGFKTNGWTLTEQITELTSRITTNVKEYVKTHLGKQIKGEVEKKTNKIIKQDARQGGDNGFLGDIETKIYAYAKTFQLQQFGNKVEEWIINILQKDPVKEWLAAYISSNANGRLGNKQTHELHTPILNAIKIAVEAAIRTAGEMIEVQGKDQIRDNIETVKKACNHFATQLEAHFTSAKINGFVKDLVDKVEKTLTGAHSNTVYSAHLVIALQATLASLAAKARQVASELDSLVISSQHNIALNLQSAIRDVKALGNSIEMEIGKTDSVPHGSAENLGHQIQTQLGNQATNRDFDNQLCELLQAAIKNGVKKLQEALNGSAISKLKSVDKSVEGVVESAKQAKEGVAGRVKEIETNLTELMSWITETGNIVKNELQKLINYKIYGSLTEVKNKIGTLRTTDLYNVIDTDIKAVNAIIASLESLPGVVDTMKGETEAKMETLQENVDVLQKLLVNIEVNVKLADEQIEKSIDVVQQCLQDSCENVTTAIELLENNLIAVVADAFQRVTQEVRAMFAKERTAHLSALKTLLSTQLKIITCTVNKNLNTGLKGFLKTLSGDSVDDYAAGYKERPKHLPPKTQKPNLLDPVKTALGGGGHGEKVKSLSDRSQAYFLHLFTYLRKDMEKHFTSQPQVHGDYHSRINTIRSNLTTLLDHISTHKHFDHQVPQMLDTLKKSLTTFTSSHFGNASYPVLDAFPRSLEQFVDELERMYVNRYDGHKQKVNMGKLVISDGDKGEKLTDDGRNLSKVFLTSLVTLKAGLDELKQNAPNAWRGRQIYLQDSNEDENSFGQFLNKCGYKVSKSHDSHEGHLRNKEQCKGQYIHDGLLVGDKQHIYHSDKNGKRALEILFDYLETYNDLCHLSTLTSKRQPCSVYEMLAWLSGLTHNPVHQSKLSVAIMNVLEELYKRGREDEGEHGDVLAVERQADGGEFKVSLVDARSVSLEAYPRDVSYDELWAAVTHICSTSYDVLCAIAGHGDEFTTYAVDYSNNHMKFNYPQNGEDCLDMLLDILRRMLPTLQYLYSQCRLSNGLNGWQACKYGKDIMTAKWPCKVHPSDEPDNKSNCQAKCKPTCQAKCEVTCQVDCQPTSPLMSYLNDCLPGHLPHQLTKIGCKYECSNCSTSKKGKPCLTPLGFKGFSGSTRMGKDICEVLTKFINIKHLTGLFTLIPKPPSTLPEHFGFTLALAIGINATSRTNNYDPHAFRGVFAASIYEQTINLCTDQSTLTNALTDAYGSPSPTHGVCEHAHVRNLTASDSCKGKTNLELECAPYLANLSVDCYRYLGKKHSNLYLSWAVYLPWSFWTNLKNLYDAFCNIYCQDWGCRGCLRGDKCKRGEHGSISDASKQPNCQCHSIVDCRGVAPTLYSYGFSFGDPSKLQNEHYPNTCADFRKQLKNVLKSEYFTKLFEECDKFLFTIREPFIWLNVALWLLSFLYLLHIMVIRLDLLHIKSHLHSPSSHRIATQSLLAAARVKALNKVLYLQP